MEPRHTKEVILHIGLHKTATTSFQALMHKRRADFLNKGVDPFQTERGLKSGRAKHGDIAFSVIRPGVLDTRPEDMLFGFDQAVCFAKTKAALAAYIAQTQHEKILISTEALSLLRTPDELEKLKCLFPENVTRFAVILVLRDKDEWLGSFRNQAVKDGIKPSTLKTSAFYFEQDSWLMDFDGLQAVYREAFGQVTVLPYDPQDMVGHLAAAVGLDLDFDTTIIRRNVSPRFPKAMRIPRLITRRLFGGEGGRLGRAVRNLREGGL